MRTPIELACLYWSSEEIEIEDFIEQIQTEAWNEAIEAILQEVEKTGLIMPNGEENLYFMNRQSILKLKK